MKNIEYIEPMTVGALIKQLNLRPAVSSFAIREDTEVVVRVGGYDNDLHVVRGVLTDCTGPGGFPLLVIEADAVGISQKAHQAGWRPGRIVKR